MLMSLFLAALLNQGAMQHAKEVSIGEAFSKPSTLLGQRIKLCGLKDKGFKEHTYVYEFGRYSGDRLGVDVNERVLGVTDRTGVTCYIGVLRRHDGLTASQLPENAKSLVVYDVIVNTSYFLAPG